MYVFRFLFYAICVGSYAGIIVGISSSSCGSVSRVVVVAYIFVMSTLHAVFVTCSCMSCHVIFIYPSSSIDSVSAFAFVGCSVKNVGKHALQI